MTRPSGSIISDAGQREGFLRSWGAREMIIMEQEHGDRVHAVEKGERPPAGDGLIMIEKGVAGVIKTADCLPVILYDADFPMAAIIHAGWRGTVRGITAKAVRLMVSLGARQDRIGAAIGPGIGACCYEVHEDVVSEFRKALFTEHIFVRRGASFFLDLKKANRELMEREGIAEIHDIGLCTACSSGPFHSARRDGNAGRQINFVLLSG
jgi:YfiH family protein